MEWWLYLVAFTILLLQWITIRITPNHISNPLFISAHKNEIEKNEKRKNHASKETEFLRLKRTRLGKDDFEPLVVIGRGAFGEVRLTCFKASKTTLRLYVDKWNFQGLEKDIWCTLWSIQFCQEADLWPENLKFRKITENLDHWFCG